MRATGTEDVVVASGIGDDETIMLVLSDGTDIQTLQLLNGSLPFPQGSWRCYQISKVGTGVASTVEILMTGGNSAAHSGVGDSLDR